MNAEEISKLEEVNFIKLPSIKQILNGIRYFLSASTLILFMVLLYGLTNQRVPTSYSSIFALMIVLLSGFALASQSYEDIIRPFKELSQAYRTESDHRRTYLILFKHATLATLWVLGFIFGILFLVIVAFAFSIIHP